MDGPGNGSPRRRFNVKATPYYFGCRKSFEVRNPAAADLRIFDFLELRLALDPRDASTQESGFTWATRTQAGQDRLGREIPAATVYFTLAGDQVVLHSLIGDDELEDES